MKDPRDFRRSGKKVIVETNLREFMDSRERERERSRLEKRKMKALTCWRKERWRPPSSSLTHSSQKLWETPARSQSSSGASRICKESRARIHDPNFDDAELFDRCRESEFCWGKKHNFSDGFDFDLDYSYFFCLIGHSKMPGPALSTSHGP